MSAKEAYQQKMEAQLKKWSAKIDVLKAKSEKTSADAKLQLQKQIENLREKQEAPRYDGAAQGGSKMQITKVMMLVTLPLTLPACGKEPQQVSPGQIRQEASETVDALTAYATQKKQEFQQQAEAALESSEKQIQELKARAEKATGEAKKKYEHALVEWNQKKEELKKQLEEFKSASASRWADAEQRIESGMDEFKKLYEKAKSALA